MWLKIFDSLMKPILLYVSKKTLMYETKACLKYFIWNFIKIFWGVNSRSPKPACRAEFGRYPLLINIQNRVAQFWHHLQISKPVRCFCITAQLRSITLRRNP